MPSIIHTVTEIPEHLLKRSRERRSAIGKGDDDSAATSESPAKTPATTAAPAAAAPAATGPAPRGPAPAPAAVTPPKPDPVYVTAAKQRKKIPFWAMATLSLMPIWGFMYVRALTESPEHFEGPLGVGAEIYSSCASCHGAAGDGGVGYAFSGGEVLKTFPHIEDQIRYVFYGTEGYAAENVGIYGSPDREGGPHVTGDRGVMPAFGGQLEPSEIIAVVCHERYTIGGADPTSDEYADEYNSWCSGESPIFDAIESGESSLTTGEEEQLGEVPFTPIGELAVPGTPD